ncbi:HET-domain-containing protein [Decorospora gaudefroyi]|uniref:HET-domain-containing protein n=1 Tax=Decorospora gaudefroyi TaxID=184978 RepID=A0A6A5K2Y8_9PLEO|nr:HET-domain-containing protein [Decorospora gaudefroyi]
MEYRTTKSHRVNRSNSLIAVAYSTGEEGKLHSLPEHEYIPLPDPLSFIRLATILPGEFDDDIRITLDHHVLKPPSRSKPERLNLAEIRRDLPQGWEAFQTITAHKYFFRNIKTGHIQWNHPDPGFHAEQYKAIPESDGVVPRYETVSYVWGDPEKSEVIIVDGPNGPNKLHVTKSLTTAVRFLRYPGQTRTLWIDAICLNQKDYEELNKQVPRMHDIYKLAWMSTLWLGTEDATSTHALRTFRYLGNQIVAEADTGLLFCAPGAEEDQWYDPDFELPWTPETWKSIHTLLRRPWFHRLWVVQEIRPSAVVQCGYERVPVAPFTEAVYCLYSKATVPDGLRQRLEQATGTMARLPALCFTRLLYRAATFKACSDPRDKIYGLLGLAPHKFAAGVNVDYEKTNTAPDVYAMAFLNHAQICQRLEHFHNCFPERSVTANAPSWVPDWWSDIPGETYIPAQFATTTSRAHFEVVYRDDTLPGNKSRPEFLRVLGVRFGEVNHTTKPLPPLLDRREAIRHVREWQPEDLNSAMYRPTNEPLRSAYALTLNCSIVKEREPDWILSSTDAWANQDFNDQALFEKGPDPLSSNPKTMSNIRSDVSDALQCCTDRLFFRNSEGYVGLGPAGIQHGDLVAIFLGCSTPLVIRPSSRGAEHYTIVGECFVHGLHDGIALLGPLPAPWVGIAAWAEGDRRVLRFLNTETQGVSREDPRLAAEDLEGWQRTDKLVDGDDPINYDFFRHEKTGEVINYDPRLEPYKLEKKGVKLEWFSLV